MATMVIPPNVVKNWEKSGKDEVYVHRIHSESLVQCILFMDLSLFYSFRLCKNCVRSKDGELSDSNFHCGENGLYSS